MNSGSIESLISTQYLNQLQKAVTGPCSKVFKTSSSENILPFSQVLSEASGKTNNVNDMFQAVFPENSVQTKIGNCNVPWEAWNRNDFPVWQYFQKNTSAECLNNWKGVGPEPPQWDQRIQQGLSQIEFGEMVILMPKSLQEKMESDPEYAEEVLNRVQKWKEDYDREDNAIAAALGYDPELHQMSKRYCIQLDENGNVGDHIVIGGGIGDKHSDGSKESKEVDEDKNLIKRTTRKVEKKKVHLVANNVMKTESYSIAFENVAPNLTELRMRKK